MKHPRYLALLVALTCTATAPAQDHGKGPDPKGDAWIKDLRLGDYCYGAETSLDDLKGKVVLVEYWGS